VRKAGLFIRIATLATGRDQRLQLYVKKGLPSGDAGFELWSCLTWEITSGSEDTYSAPAPANSAIHAEELTFLAKGPAATPGKVARADPMSNCGYRQRYVEPGDESRSPRSFSETAASWWSRSAAIWIGKDSSKSRPR